MARKVAWIALALALAAPAPARADDKKARELFEKGVELFERGDHAGARESFEAAAKLVDYPIVLYDLGLCYEALGDPVRAVRTMEKVLAAPGSLKAERVEHAKKTLEEQRKKIARLTLRSKPDGAEVRVGGVLVGRTPLVDVELPAGTAHIEVTLDGHGVQRKSENLGGQQKVELELTLEPSQKKLAHVRVRSALPGADIAIDGLTVAKTPYDVTLAVDPGQHRFEVRRPGYVSAGETLVLAEGATGEVTLTPTPDPKAAALDLGKLALVLDQKDASVLVDGARRDPDPLGITLPVGPHVVRIERTGFEPLELRLEVPSQGTLEKRLDLIPTPELRSRWLGEASAQRIGGWVAVGAGVAFAGASAGLLGWNAAGKGALSAENADEKAKTGAYAICNSGDQALAAQCKAKREDLFGRNNVSTGVDVGAALGLGVGLTGVVVGAVLLATVRDTSKLERKPPDAWGSLAPLVHVGQTGWQLGLAGSF